MGNSSPFIVIGVGNLYRTDDAVGIVIAQRLKDRKIDDFEVHENPGEISTLMELLEDAGTVILIDAVSSGSEPGKIFIYDASKGKIPVDNFRCSTHAFSIPEAVELSRVLGQLPKRVFIYGVEGKDFSEGERLSPEVEASVEVVIDHLLSQIQDIRKGTSEI